MILYKQDYIILLMLVVMVVLWGVRTHYDKELSVKGTDLYVLQQQIKKQQLENALLREQIIHLQAFTNIELKAEGQGFRRAMPTDYVILW